MRRTQKRLMMAMAAATGLMTAVVLALPGQAAEDALLKQAKELFQPIPDTPPKIADNPITKEKVELGRMLYFDPRLSGSHFISCNSCHNLGMGGDDNETTSIGHGWTMGPRNAPTVLNAVFNASQFWDGRAKDLKDQAKGPVQNPIEMHNTAENAVKTLKSMPGYVKAFKAAFPKDEDPVTFDNMAKAIEAFEATLITPDSRFDRFLKGDVNALNEKERKGLALFIDKGCAGCHNGVNLGGQDFQKFGVAEEPPAVARNPEDTGREKITGNADDRYVFRVAPLRNIALTAPYFHTGKVWDLKEAVKIMADSQLGKGTVNDEEADAIVAFLKTLTGRQPKVEYPVLPVETAETPKPAPAVDTKAEHK